MKTITVDGTEYVSKKDYDNKLIIEEKIKISKPYLIHEDLILGVGSSKLTGEWIRVKIDIVYLEQAIRILKQIGVDVIDLCFTTDCPLCLGEVDKMGKFAGVMIAPRIDPVDTIKKGIKK